MKMNSGEHSEDSRTAETLIRDFEGPRTRLCRETSTEGRLGESAGRKPREQAQEQRKP